MRVLILGGTTEASALAHLLAQDARFEATLSLAGRTTTPRPQPIATRIGGFGGADGLARYIVEHRIAAVIDATHPYADQMSANAVAACRSTGVPLASLIRTAWTAKPGDVWQNVASTQAAVAALGPTRCCVFLTVGRQELHVFASAPQHHYVARLIEPPQQADLPPDLVLLRQRGPFDLEAERHLLNEQKIDVIVSKNSGGSATYAKIEAARELGLPVIMIARPDKPAGHAVASPEEAAAWLAHARSPGSLRGV
jgi:precorrin-6A/cobalt-precorrin-6A reductase